MHGGASTGPVTAEGRRRVGHATRERWIAWAIAEGWRFASLMELRLVRERLAIARGSRNATAKALGLSTHGLRRVLVGLPLRPEEAGHLDWLVGRRVLTGLTT